MVLRELVNLIKFNVDDTTLRAAEKKIENTISGLDRFGRRASLLFTAPIAALTALSVKTSSDAIETQNKFNQVFGDLSKEATKFAEDYSRSVGRFKSDTQSGMAAIQSMAVGLGFTNDKSFELSKKMQRLAIDFGSFNNLSDDEAQERFLSALSGSSEVVTRFGINLKQAAIDQELLAMGLGKTAAKASEAEKFLARINIIEKTMTRQGAVGDAIRTLGDFANKSRSFFSRIKSVMVSFGDKVIPILNRLLDVGLGLLDWIENLSDSSKNLILIFAGLLAIVGPLALGLAGLLTVVKSLMLFSSFLGGLQGLSSAGFALLQPQFLLIAGAILVAVAALGLFIEDVMTWVQGGDSLIGKLLGPWEDWAKNLKEMFSLMIEDFGTFGKAMGIALVDGLSSLSDELEKTTFGKIMKWVSLIKPAEILAEFAGSTIGASGGIFDPDVMRANKKAEDAAFAAYNTRVRQSQINVDSKITVGVPAGTAESQIAVVKEAAKKAVQETFSEQVSRLYDNEVR